VFVRAVASASQFTFPYVGLRRRASGVVDSTIGSFVVLNESGWALTAAHVVQDILAAQRDVDAGPAAAEGSEDACTQHVEIWAMPGFDSTRPHIAEAIVRGISDVAAVRLEPFDSGGITEFAALRDDEAAPIEQGLAVCRYGYPFHAIQSGWDEERQEFQLPEGAFPVASFALDGIVARFHRSMDEQGNEATFIATSTPGLRGQSGGPLMDVEGRVCGLQSHTAHLDLGFEGVFSAGDQVVTERQFLNVGVASHVTELRGVLDEAGIAYRLA
jgi:hypothetical protein